MKKGLFIISLVLSLFLAVNVYAQTSGTLTVDKDTIGKGGQFTAKVELKEMAAWNVHVIVDGNVKEACIVEKVTVDGEEKDAIINEADVTDDAENTNKTFTATCTAAEEGEIKLKLYGDITSSDGENIELSATKTITVSGTATEEEKTNPKTGAFLDITLVIIGLGIMGGITTIVNKKRKMI